MEDSDVMISTFKSKPITKPRLSTCQICKGKFAPARNLQSICFNNACAVEKGRRDTEKQERKDLKVRKEAIKTLSDRAKPAQAAVNRYVNARDSGKPCISCGKPDRGVRNASHYKSRGSNSALRFNLWNINSSCYSCNCEKSGNIGEYRPRLIERIGAEKVEWLENHPRSREYSPEYLKRITKIFNKKTKRMKAGD